jgi:hypothetical protein
MDFTESVKVNVNDYFFYRPNTKQLRGISNITVAFALSSIFLPLHYYFLCKKHKLFILNDLTIRQTCEWTRS